jgi:hypothetical protein
MNIEKLTEPLKTEDIEIRVGHITEYNGVYTMYLLAYKTSRIDVVRLNEAFGPLGWQDKYRYDEKSNLVCAIGVYDEEHKHWVWKEDVGTESNTEKEKGSYSDALKRAGFRWGIGTELYKIKNLKCLVDEKDIRKRDYQGKSIYSYKWSLSEWELRYDENGNAQVYDNFGKLRTIKNNYSKTQQNLDLKTIIEKVKGQPSLWKVCQDNKLQNAKIAQIYNASGGKLNAFKAELDNYIKELKQKSLLS